MGLEKYLLLKIIKVESYQIACVTSADGLHGLKLRPESGTYFNLRGPAVLTTRLHVPAPRSISHQ